MIAEGLTVEAVRRRFLTLIALRWFPTGLAIPVLVLLVRDRGLSFGEIGMVTAAQGFVVLALELPTGGLADTLGRRPTLLLANVIDLASLLLVASARSLPLLAVAFALQGVYRALESGPLEAWYVDATRELDDEADVELGLGRATAVLSVAIATGALSSAGIVALDRPVFGTTLATPIVVAIAARAIGTLALARLMIEVRRPLGPAAVIASIRSVPGTISEAVAQVRGSHLLMALLAIEALWGFGSAGYEVYFAPRMAELAGDAERAAVVLGPTVTAAWLASALGAAALPRLRRRFSLRTIGIAMRIGQGAATAAIGATIGVWGAVAFYLGGYATHGAANVVHQTLLHGEITEHRATVLSANSMMGQTAGAIGGIVIGVVADGIHVSAALWVSGAALAVAAPLFLVGRHPERPTPTDTPRSEART